MRKLLLLSLMLASVALAGCLPQAQATPSPTPTATAAPQPVPTAVIIPGEMGVLPDAGCTVISRKPTPGPTAESIYPPVSDTEWVKGPSSAKVTIIEYSDFQ